MRRVPRLLRVRPLAKLFAGPVLALAGLNHFACRASTRRSCRTTCRRTASWSTSRAWRRPRPALATLHPRTRRAGGVLGIATLVAVFPANLHMALHPERYRKIPPWALYARLPVQALFIYWVLARGAGRRLGLGTEPAGRRRASGGGPGSPTRRRPGSRWCRAARSRRSGRAPRPRASRPRRASCDSRCSIVRGPMIAAVTAGWRITNAIAISIRVMPASSASRASASAASSLRWFSGIDMS